MNDAEAAGRVAEALAADLPRYLGSGARVLSVSPPQPHAWSFQFAVVAACAGGRRDLVVKIPRWEEAPTLRTALAAGPQESTRREHAALEAMASAIAGAGDPGLAAVAPVAYVPAVNAIVTERLAALPLRSRLGLPGTEGSEAETLRRAGRALRLFHDRVAEARAGVLDGNGLAAEFEDPAARRAFGRAAARGALDALAGEARRRHGEPVITGAAHGDCNLVNVLVTGDGRVALLDFNLVPGPLLEDAAKLLVALRFRRARVLTLGALGGTGLAQAEAAFLEGYGPHDADLLRLLRGVAVVRRHLEVSGRLGGVAGPLHAVLGRSAARELRRLTG